MAPTEPKSALFAELRGGVRTGLLLHSILEHANFQALDGSETQRLIERELHTFGLDTSLAPVVQRDLLAVAATPFTSDPDAPRLTDLSADRQLRELEFTLGVDRPSLGNLAELLKQHRAPAAAPSYYERLAEVGSQTLQRFLRGYIDMMFEWQGRWYVADYKSNTLPTYEPEAVNEAVQREHYVLQAQLYTAAAHRYLNQRVEGYDPETHWGGALFLFLRGMRGPESAGSGVFFDRQSAGLLKAIDRWLGGGDESR
jgi:exodeoxyribonuclease V beta subunit